MSKFWTDYPIEALGDVPFKKAPVRECEPFSYDGNKYLKVRIGGVVQEIKRGYVYTKPGRCGDVNQIDRRAIKRALRRYADKKPLAAPGETQ